MNSIETARGDLESRADALARSTFDEAIAPAAEARGAEGQLPYFPRGFDAAAASYFDDVAEATNGDNFAFPGDGDPNALLDALSERWMQEGDARLAALVPRLKTIAEALAQEASEGDGSVDPYCYTMF